MNYVNRVTPNCQFQIAQYMVRACVRSIHMKIKGYITEMDIVPGTSRFLRGLLRWFSGVGGG